MGRMLLNISISAPEPWEIGPPAGGAPLSTCKTKTKAAVRIGIHLSIHGIRRGRTFQVIDMVPLTDSRRMERPGDRPFMLCCARIRCVLLSLRGARVRGRMV